MMPPTPQPIPCTNPATAQEAHDTLVEFFGAVLPPQEDGNVYVWATPYPKNHANDTAAMKQAHCRTIGEMVSAILSTDASGSEAYFAPASYQPHQTDSGNPGRKGSHVTAVKAFWLDIDCGPDKAAAGLGYATKKDAFTTLVKFCEDCNLPAPSYLIDSGGGVHVYWALERAVTPEEWRSTSKKLKELAAKHGFIADPARTGDIASILRPPGTHNHKQAIARPVRIKHRAPAIAYADFSGAINSAHAAYYGTTETAVALAGLSNLTVAAKTPPAETAEEKLRVESMLSSLSANCAYDLWRDIVWAICSLGWDDALAIANKWSQSAPERYDYGVFQRVWDSYQPNGGIHFATLEFHARAAGWLDAAATTSPAASGAVIQDFEQAQADTSSDIKNGRCFAAMYRDKYLFVEETGDLLEFAQNTGWIHAEPGEADRAAKAVVATLRTMAANRWREAPDDAKNKRLMAHVERSSAEPKIRAMISMAKSEPGMTVRLSRLDADLWLLGVENGVLDLRTGALLPISPSLLVTKRCRPPYDPEAVAPNWEKFIERITQGTPTLATFLQRLTGYLLTGTINEHCFAFLYGLGRNGKTTYSEAIYWLMGDYATILPTATLMLSKRDPGAASPDLMLLKGRRLALASELEENARFAEAAIKSMTGGDTMNARNPYGQFTSWTPTHKLLIVGNHRPVIAGGDYGIWRRVRLIPFTETIGDSECDEKLPEKLQAEGAGILNWALAGLQDWRRQGLNPPAEVTAAGAAYQSDMDTLGQWMDDHVDRIPGAQTGTGELYKAYCIWAKESGWSRPMTRQAFGRRLADRNIPLAKGGTGHKVARGIALNADGRTAAIRGGQSV